MTASGMLLENHTLMVRSGRIIDLLPSARAASEYAGVPIVDRCADLLMPGLVNAFSHAPPAPASGPAPPSEHAALAAREDAARLRAADMIASGTTCFCGSGSYPDEIARIAAEQGLRALIGLPVWEGASPWARGPGECLTRALALRDEYLGHPSIHTAFAPHPAAALDDETLARIGTLAAELDAGIVLPLHESLAAIETSQLRHGRRPLERLHALGLLTPALTAAHLTVVEDADLELAVRGGIAVALCPEADLAAGNAAAPVTRWTRTGLRLGLGSAAVAAGSLDLWSALRLFALLGGAPAGGTQAGGTQAGGLPAGDARAGDARADHLASTAWEALAAATRGGAAALGLDAEIGTLEPGKWADVCCIDMRANAMQSMSGAAPGDCAALLVRNGNRSLVSDVWIAGRQLLARGAFTRLDFRELAARHPQPARGARPAAPRAASLAPIHHDLDGTDTQP